MVNPQSPRASARGRNRNRCRNRFLLLQIIQDDNDCDSDPDGSVQLFRVIKVGDFLSFWYDRWLYLK